MIEALADEAERGYDIETLEVRSIGRPSLSGGGESPRVQFRVAPTTYKRALQRGRREGMPTMSAVARALLDAYADGDVTLPTTSPHRRPAKRRK